MKKSLTFILLAAMFVIVLSGCSLDENIDRYSPFASKTDVYGVVKGEPKLDSKAQENGVTSYSYDLVGYDKDLNKIDLGFGSKEKHPVGTYIKAVKKGSDTRMHDVAVVKKEDVPENILKKLDEK
ncbi:YxeA family protein [Paenibacillus larvae]